MEPPDAEELLDALSGIRRALRQHTNRPAELAALTGAQLELVRLLRRRPGVSVGEAAELLNVAPNTISTLVRELTAAGGLTRRADAIDRRVVRLELAPELQVKVAAWRDRRVEEVAAALAGLPAPERRRLTAAMPALTRLAAAVAARGSER